MPAPTPTPTPAPTPSAANGNLTALPETVLIDAGAALGTTTIRWKGNAEITVPLGTNPETLFAGGVNGSANAPWIQREAYVFRLYGMPQRRLAASVTVRGVTRPRPGMGCNAFDLVAQYHGNASGGGGPRTRRASA